METLCPQNMLLATLVANVVLFLSDLFGLFPLLIGDFSIPAIEASGGFQILYSNKLWEVFFCRKKL